MEKIIVFLGPSLLLDEARCILPDAYYLPPARCGDILRVLRLQPTGIVLIDGYFENTPAVWHKEILIAMERGVWVIGGSSMGALRASELNDLGMQGTGKIFSEYLDGTRLDDDDVAVLHSSQQSEYQPSTEAMVNIEAALKSALEQKVLDTQSYHSLLHSAKSLFYAERTWQNIIRHAVDNSLSPPPTSRGLSAGSMQKDKEQPDPADKPRDVEPVCSGSEIPSALLKEPDSRSGKIASFQAWLNSTKIINIKKEDAIAALKAALNPKPKSAVSIHRSAFIRALQKNIACRPFSSFQDWLPIQEKTALMSRYFGDTYQWIRRLAYLLSACHALAEQSVPETMNIPKIFGNATFLKRREYSEATPPSPLAKEKNSILKDHEYMPSCFTLPENPLWLIQNDCSEKEKQSLTNRLLKIASLVNKEKASTDLPGTPEDYLLLLMRFSSHYVNYKSFPSPLEAFRQQEPDEYHLLNCAAHTWFVIERHALRKKLQPNITAIQEYSEQFRIKRQLLSQEAIEQWLTENDLDSVVYQYWMTAMTRLTFLVFQNNLDSLNILENDQTIWWFLDTLRLSGFYIHAKALIGNSEKIRHYSQKIQHHPLALDFYLNEIDFIQ